MNAVPVIAPTVCMTGPPSNTTMIYELVHWDFVRTRRLLRWSTVAGAFGGISVDKLDGICGIEMTHHSEDSSWMEGAETPHVPSCRKWEALSYQGSSASSYQDWHSHVLSCPIPSYPQPCYMDELVPPGSKVSVIFACEFVHALCLRVSSFICGGDVKQGHTPLQYICLIGRV